MSGCDKRQGMAMSSRRSERPFSIETWWTISSLRLPGVPPTHLEPKRVFLVLICTVLGVRMKRVLVDDVHVHYPVNLSTEPR